MPSQLQGMGLRGGVLAPVWQMSLNGESWEPFLEKLEGWPRGAREARSPVRGPSCHPRGWITPASLAPSIFLAAGRRV